ncbi:MAG: TetR/AcrR family transcriptional regulator [Cytophagales bacterium]|nr:TetR/AcrR family transcriptional regulator [Cytophagales bacterium]
MKKEKKELIFKAALHLFTKNGFQETPTSLIAKQAGVATGTLFHYFKTKEDLIERLYLYCNNSFASYIEKGVDTATDLEKGLRTIFSRSVQWGLRHKKEFRYFQQYVNSPYFSNVTKEESEKVYGVLHDVFEKGKKAGIFRRIDAEILMDLTYGVFISAVYHILVKKIRDKNEIDKVIEDCFSVFLIGIKAGI